MTTAWSRAWKDAARHARMDAEECKEWLDAASDRIAELEEVLRQLVEPKIRENKSQGYRFDQTAICSGDQGVNCVYCSWDDCDLFAMVEHEEDCPVRLGRKLLEGS